MPRSPGGGNRDESLSVVVTDNVLGGAHDSGRRSRCVDSAAQLGESFHDDESRSSPSCSRFDRDRRNCRSRPRICSERTETAGMTLQAGPSVAVDRGAGWTKTAIRSHTGRRVFRIAWSSGTVTSRGAPLFLGGHFYIAARSAAMVIAGGQLPERAWRGVGGVRFRSNLRGVAGGIRLRRQDCAGFGRCQQPQFPT